MQFTNLSLALLSATLVLALHADPLIYIKNNSDRLISVKPLTNYTQYEEKAIKPDSGELWEHQGSSEPINGLHIRYCPGTPETDDCNDSLQELQKVGNSTAFTLKAPDAKKYYLKVDIGANNTVLLKPQEGLFGSTTGAYKYSLKNNIKKDQISVVRTAPTQRMPLPAAPTDMPPKLPSETSSFAKATADRPTPTTEASSFVIKKTTVQIPKTSTSGATQGAYESELAAIIRDEEAYIQELRAMVDGKAPADYNKFNRVKIEQYMQVPLRKLQQKIDKKYIFTAQEKKLLAKHQANYEKADDLMGKHMAKKQQ